MKLLHQTLFLSLFGTALMVGAAPVISEDEEEFYQCFQFAEDGSINGPDGTLRILLAPTAAFTGGAIIYKDILGAGTSYALDFTGGCQREKEVTECKLWAVGTKTETVPLNTEPTQLEVSFKFDSSLNTGSLILDSQIATLHPVSQASCQTKEED